MAVRPSIQSVILWVSIWKEDYLVADLAIVRLTFIAVLSVLSFYQRPFGLGQWEAGGLGLGLAIAIIIFEIRLKQASLTRLIGAAIGSILGILGAFLMSRSEEHTSELQSPDHL